MSLNFFLNYTYFSESIFNITANQMCAACAYSKVTLSTGIPELPRHIADTSEEVSLR